MERLSKRLIIFDVDGTVWNSEPDVFLSFNHTLKVNLGIEIGKSDFQNLAGLHLESMFEYVLPEHKKHLATELESKFKRYYVDEGHFTDKTVLFPHVLDTLRYFKERGFFLTIASSKPERVLNKMVLHFNLDCFDLILGTEESPLQHKPHPEIVNVTLDRLNTGREDAVIVGDSGVDVRTGKNANIDTVAVTYGFGNSETLRALKPTCVIDDFKDLIGIIEYRE